MSKSTNTPRDKMPKCYSLIGCLLFLAVAISASLDLSAESNRNQASQIEVQDLQAEPAKI